MSESMDTLKIAAHSSSAVGNARIMDTEPVVAGEFGTWQLIFTVGSAGLKTGGVVRIGTDSDSDWGLPQLDDPTAAEYLSVVCPPDAEVATQVPDLVTVLIINTGRPLSESEEVLITYGDRTGGGKGSRSQTFIEARRYFWIEVDVTGSGDFIGLETNPEMPVVGGEAARLVVIAPSNAVAEEKFRISIKAEDRWGNPSSSYRGTVNISGSGIVPGADEVRFDDDSGGVVWVDGCRVTEPGELRVEVRDDAAGLEAVSNPIVASEDSPRLRLYWAIRTAVRWWILTRSATSSSMREMFPAYTSRASSATTRQSLQVPTISSSRRRGSITNQVDSCLCQDGSGRRPMIVAAITTSISVASIRS